MSRSKIWLVSLVVAGAVLTALFLGLSSGELLPPVSETCGPNGWGPCRYFYPGVGEARCAVIGGSWGWNGGEYLCYRKGAGPRE